MKPAIVLVLALSAQDPAPAASEAGEASEASTAPQAEAVEAEGEIAPEPGAQAPAEAPAMTPSTGVPAEAVAASGASTVTLEGAIDDLLARSADAVRVAVPPVVDADEARARAMQAALVRVILDRGREEVVTPAMVSRVLGDAAAAAASGNALAFKALAADHVLLAEVVDAAGSVSLRMRLVHVESGGVLSSASAPIDEVAAQTSANASTVRGGLDRAVDGLTTGLGALPGDHRYQRVAVAPLSAQGEAVVDSRVDRFVQAELGDRLRARGYLVVERARLDQAMGQLALGAQMGDESAGELGQLLDAQALVLGSVSEAGDAFLVTLRAVGVSSGTVLGAAEVSIPREGVVTLASGAIETRSAPEAAFRSAVAPGWGQFYNRSPVKGVAFGAVTYGAAITTVGLGVGSAVLYATYTGYCVDECETPPAKRPAEAQALREQTNALITATLVSGVITGAAWSASAADALIDGLSLYE
jgi:hypothetical protein